MQMIFQDPYASLNPRMRVVDIVGEAPVAHGMVAAGGQSEYVAQQLNRVGLDGVADAALPAPVLRRPAGADRHRPRARGEARVPRLRRVGRGARRVDPGAGAEPVHGAPQSALDLTYLFISHDLGVVEHISDRVVIMYLGRVVESGPTPELYARAEPSVHAGAAGRGGQGRARQAHVRADQGRDSVAARAAAGLPFPSPLPACDGDLPDDGAGVARNRAGTLVVLPPERWRAPSDDRVPPFLRHGPDDRRAAARHRFAAFGRALSRRLRPRPAARDRAARGGHARRAALPRRDAIRRRADRGDVSPRLHRREPQPCRSRSRDAGRAVALSRSRLRARPSRASGSSGGSRGTARRCTDARSRSPRCGGASTAATFRIMPPLAAEIDALHRAFGAVWHINAHSMPAVGDANADDPGRERADVVLGDRDGTTCEPEFTDAGRATLPRHGLLGRDQRSVQGRRARPEARAAGGGRHSLQIELNRRLYMDEATLEPNAGYANLEDDLRRLAGVLAQYVGHPLFCAARSRRDW